MRSIAIIPATARPDPGRGPVGHETPADTRSRSLVTLDPRSRHSSCGCAERPSSTFLAHLIATTQHAPQTRQRRRAEPASACAHYATARESAPATLFLGWI
jgi:hypothetical protein